MTNPAGRLSTQTAFQRRFVSYVKRCDELERKLRYFKTEIDQFGLPIQVTDDVWACVCVFAGVFFASNAVRWRVLRTWFVTRTRRGAGGERQRTRSKMREGRTRIRWVRWKRWIGRRTRRGGGRCGDAKVCRGCPGRAAAITNHKVPSPPPPPDGHTHRRCRCPPRDPTPRLRHGVS